MHQNVTAKEMRLHEFAEPFASIWTSVSINTERIDKVRKEFMYGD